MLQFYQYISNLNLYYQNWIQYNNFFRNMSVHRPNLPETIWCLQPPFDDLNFWTQCTITTRNNYKPKCQTTSWMRNNTTRNSRERIQVHLQWSIPGWKIITWCHPKSSSTLQKRRKNLCQLPCPQSPHQNRHQHLVVCVPSAPPPTTNPGAGFVGEIKFPGGKIYYQKQIIIVFFEAKFSNMYPVGMLFDVSGSQVRMLNPTWNEAVLKWKHTKNQDPKMWTNALYQTTKSHAKKEQQCKIDWSNNANQREEAENTGRDHWIEAAEYWELEIERIQQGLEADEREK